jgi:hypothetical protein
MIKRLAVLVLVLCISVAAGMVPVQAQSGLRITDTSIEAAFPLELSFNISVESDADITDIRFHYRVERLRFVDVTSEAYLEFTPSRTVEVNWDWDMRRTGGLPPGTSIEYWWTVEDASGDSIETEPLVVQFEDDRFQWQSLVEGQVTAYWYRGTTSFAGDIMETVQEALYWLVQDTGVSLTEPVRIYIYGSSADLRGSMIFPQEWTGGVAFTRYGCIAIGISPANLTWGRRAIAHELTHLVIHQMTLNPYGGLPVWLDEGLAMRSEGPLGREFQEYLDRAIARDSLFSVRSLASPFSTDAEKSYLSYAQSYSLVEYLISTYGKDRMFELLDTLSEGSTYDNALTGVYGFNSDGLERRWREYLMSPAETVEQISVFPGRG